MSAILSSNEQLSLLTNGHLVTVQIVYLTDGRVATAIQSETPYTTTFNHGQVRTICGLNGQCKVHDSDQTQASYQTITSHTLSGTVASDPKTIQTVYITKHASSHSGNNTALSSGNIPGIVVAGIVALLAIVGISVYILWRRLRIGRRPNNVREIQDEPVYVDGIGPGLPAELHGDGARVEILGNALHEVESPRPELQGDEPRSGEGQSVITKTPNG